MLNILPNRVARNACRSPRPEGQGVKKPMAAVITRLVENGDQLLLRQQKQPLEDLQELRDEARESVGSTLETSDSEVVGCRRGTNKICRSS